MLTNPRDAFRGQSRSQNMVPFDMLGMVSYYCSIVTLSLRSFSDIPLQKRPELEIWIRGHSRSSEPIQIDPPPMTSY